MAKIDMRAPREVDRFRFYTLKCVRQSIKNGGFSMGECLFKNFFIFLHFMLDKWQSL